MSLGPTTTRRYIDDRVHTTGAGSPEEAIRKKARELIELCESTIGPPEMPIDVDMLTGMQGIVRPVVVQKTKKKRSAIPDNSPTLFDW